MTYDHELYQDFPSDPEKSNEPNDPKTGTPRSQEPGPAPLLQVQGELRNVRNMNVARGNITQYMVGLAHLRPHPVSRRQLLPEQLFVPPTRPGGERSAVPPPAPVDGGVLALLGDEESGRRTAALDFLDTVLDEGQRIFELFPDWEQPDVSRIPDEPDTGYLLNLSGVREPLGSRFHEQLTQYATRAAATGTRLVIIATTRVWNNPAADSRNSMVSVMTIGRPSSKSVAERRIAAHPERAARTAWLQASGGVFADLLRGDESPAEGVRLAEIVLQAKGVDDAEARDRFRGWEHKLTDWFGGADPEAPEYRALQISAAVFDGCPARVVLDAADALLGDSCVNWPARKGGPLAGADDTQRCSDADVHFASDGTVSLSHDRPGIDRALLRHVWRNRPQLVPVLTGWLSGISRPGGIAEGSLVRLAEVLTTVAEAEGPDAVLNLTSQWLLSGRTKHTGLAVDLLDQLAVDARFGAAVRAELTNWAKAHTKPQRQRAVAAVCRGRLGREYTSIALTRLKYVLDSAQESGVRDAAVGALGELLRNADLCARVLKTLVEWMGVQGRDEASRAAFLAVLAAPAATDESSLARMFLALDGEHGDAVRQLLKKGWQAAWRCPELRTRASEVLDAWCEAASEGLLPLDAVEEVVSAVFLEEPHALGDDLNKVIGGAGELRARLRVRYVRQIQESIHGRSPGPDGPTGMAA
ncbi:hypothetical protein [Streptomyces sp. NPDC048442]|uniref:hypothetical protein n=1 Tax=Streptomyces sp. NPDC048442 TaxID=3154823 RepID=UPI00341B6066